MIIFMGKITLVLVGIIGVFLAYQVGRTIHYIRVGRGIEKVTIPFARSLLGATKRILVIGDSSAVGVGAGAPSQSVAGLLGEHYPGAEIVNAGVSGARTRELSSRLAAFSGQRFDLVLVQIGGNDIVRFTDQKALGASLGSALDEAKKLSNNVVLMSSGNVGTALLFPPGVRWLHERKTRQVREQFMAIAAGRNVAYVDLFRERAQDPFASEPAKFYAADYFHPSALGYSDWFERMVPHLPVF